jgi:hypothetical protein
LREIITGRTWKRVSVQARSAPTRRAAIAYVTTNDVGLRSGDTLVTDASLGSIRAGHTDAKLLLKLYDEGVAIYSLEGLHSKVVLFGRIAVVGSANMSRSRLTEASILTDDPVITAGVAAFIKAMTVRRNELSRTDIKRLCGVKVVRRGYNPSRSIGSRNGKIGNRTWIVSVQELQDEPTVQQQRRIDRRVKEINKARGVAEDYEWIRWTRMSRFARECRAGDNLFEVFRPLGRKRPVVYRGVRVLLRDREPTLVRFYVQASERSTDTVSWSRFKRILAAAGCSRRVTQNSVLQIENDLADAIHRKWSRVS